MQKIAMMFFGLFVTLSFSALAENMSPGAKAKLAQGDAAFQKGAYTEAIEAYSEVVRDNPGGDAERVALLRLGNAQAANGKKGEAIATWKSFLVRFPNSPDTLYARIGLAQNFVELSEWKDAYAILSEMPEKTLKNQPEEALSRYYELAIQSLDQMESSQTLILVGDMGLPALKSQSKEAEALERIERSARNIASSADIEKLIGQVKQPETKKILETRMVAQRAEGDLYELPVEVLLSPGMQVMTYNGPDLSNYSQNTFLFTLQAKAKIAEDWKFKAKTLLGAFPFSSKANVEPTRSGELAFHIEYNHTFSPYFSIEPSIGPMYSTMLVNGRGYGLTDLWGGEINLAFTYRFTSRQFVSFLPRFAMLRTNSGFSGNNRLGGLEVMFVTPLSETENMFWSVQFNDLQAEMGTSLANLTTWNLNVGLSL